MNKPNKFFLFSGFAWFLIFQILAIKDINTIIPVNYFTAWDAFWVPIMAVLFPYFLGVMTFYKDE